MPKEVCDCGRPTKEGGYCEDCVTILKAEIEKELKEEYMYVNENICSDF